MAFECSLDCLVPTIAVNIPLTQQQLRLPKFLTWYIVASRSRRYLRVLYLRVFQQVHTAMLRASVLQANITRLGKSNELRYSGP